MDIIILLLRIYYNSPSWNGKLVYEGRLEVRMIPLYSGYLPLGDRRCLIIVLVTIIIFKCENIPHRNVCLMSFVKQ